MTEDFALIDFALTARSPADVTEAIGRAQNARTQPRTDAGQTPRGGVLSRLFGRAKAAGHRGGARDGLLIQPFGQLPHPPLARAVLADLGGAGDKTPVRLSSPLGVAGLTLIEFREVDGETSTFCETLSDEMQGDELFYFRHSGSLHPGAHFAFHVYRDGRPTRRSESVSFQGTAPESEWQGTDSGMPHPLETDSLPAPGTAQSEIMTPVRQAVILEALGLDPEALFIPNDAPGALVVELSRARDGRPISDVQAVILEQRPAPASTPDLSPAVGDASETGNHRAAAPAAMTAAATALAEPGAKAPSWEEEVTALLVEAVETALPAEQQVGWLDTLTTQLMDGDVDGALEEAGRMILAGNRSEDDKSAAIARLLELFGRAG